MSDHTFHCPRCGKKLNYDFGMGFWWCPDPDCGTVVQNAQLPGRRPAVESRSGYPAASLSASGSSVADEDEEWQPRGRGTGWRIAAGLVAVLTAVAVLMMGLSPLNLFRGVVLSVSPSDVTFVDDLGTGPMPQAIALQNDGKGEMHWQVTSDVSWLSTEPSGGVLDDDLQVLTLRADVAGLVVGEYEGLCTVAAEDCRNSPQIVRVLLRVEQTPETRAIHSLVGDGVEVFYGEQPPYVEGPSGDEIYLVNNDMADDVSWNALVAFLLEDDTDGCPYLQGELMCGTFAEMLHNNAEAAGIRAAWVSIDMLGQEIGHALNAFLTTDRGVVFIDCTGKDAVLAVGADDNLEGCDYDKVAFVKEGREYGLVSLEYAEPPGYPFYEQYTEAWSEYLADLEEFNALADEYNALANGPQLIAGSPEARRAKTLFSELQRRRVALEMKSELLGPCRWESVGVVEQVELYW